jgi:hypothetical protein
MTFENSYNSRPKDKDGWVKAEYPPKETYRLVRLITERGEKMGWWTGGNWDGLNITKDIKVMKWKKTNYL